MGQAANTVNQTLTNYAKGLAQDVRSKIADFIAPEIPVGSASGQYKAYDDKNAFQIYDTSRAIGGGATRIEFAASDPYFNCKPNALEIAIDDHERDLAGANNSQLEEAKTKMLVTSAVIAHENAVITAIKAAISATGSKGVWSSSSNDPVTEIDSQIEAIATETGMLPNRIVFGLGAWNVFRNHAKVIARQPGASLIGLSSGQASSLFLNPSVEIQVGVLGKDSAKFGAAKSATNIVGAEVFIFFASASPTQYDASFAKTFRTARGGVESVRMYRAENNRSDILAVDWTTDIKVTASAACRRLTIS